MSGNLRYFVNFSGYKSTFVPVVREVAGKFFCSVLKCVITLYNVCAVLWGCSVPWGVQYRGGYHEYCGGDLEYRGVFSTVGDIMGTEYLEYCGVFSTVGDIMSTMGVILSTVGDTQYHGGHHDYCGVFSTLGDTIL